VSASNAESLPTPCVAVVAYPDFSPYHLSVPCLIFGGDILHHGHLFSLQVCAEDARPVRASHGFSLAPPTGLEALADADIVIVPGWRDPAVSPSPALVKALHAAHARGAQVVGLCLGTYVLAYAGLLDGRKAATHWEAEDDFVKRFPQVQLDTNALYVEDGGLLTSAGAAAGMDCCLYLVRKRYGGAIANRIARRLVVPTYREGGQAQFIEKPVPVSTHDARINTLLEYLRSNLDTPLSLDDLAQQAHLSRRTLTRAFQQATGMSVGEWLLAERLRRAQELLESSEHSVEVIAGLVGFGSATSLRQHFHKAFGIAPGEWRRHFRKGDGQES